MRLAIRSFLLTVAVSLACAAGARAQGSDAWHRAFPAFKIAGNLYYVGTADLAAYLVVTPQGNILINSDFKEDVPTIRASIERLGFKYGDTKILLISHAHGDHDEGTGLIKSQTGAKLMVMDADVREEESTAPGRPGAHVDRTLHDGDVVELGGTKLVAHLTPGHTPGCTTWTMQVADGGRTLNAVVIGSPNVNPGYVLVHNRTYPGIAADYITTFALLKTLPVDLFLGAHGAYFGLTAKYAKLKPGAANPFIDPAGYKAYVAEREDAFVKELTKQTEAAHAGDTVGFDIAWNHVALSVPSIAESIAWYEKMLGFKGTVRGQPTPNARQQVADLRRGNVTIELFQVADAAPLPASRKNPSEDFRTHGVKHFGFEVKNLPAVLAELRAKGVTMAFDMRDTPTERFAFISDNAGNAIELIEHKTR
ncbi:MAG TPA: subclass B3 metallo-beta-lactamase [Vicinamibacterales bacterium]|nr:subclass B3 metallo-beta-lactamase [Vicinamibacterales bacterium]